MTAHPLKWNADQYVRFLNERTRPAVELLARVRSVDAEFIIDLGCGPGNSTALLKQRWPVASVTGVDTSGEMLVRARADHPDISFIEADIESWSPTAPVDLIFSNAAYQWVPDHSALLPRLAAHLRANGVMAMQMPCNHDAPTHVSMREVASEHSWSVDLTGVRSQPPVLKPQAYYDILSPFMSDIDVWQTTYFHLLPDIAAVVEWLKGTGLRPFIAALSLVEQTEFLRFYAEKLAACMPTQVDGQVLLPFPRLFVVARLK